MDDKCTVCRRGFTKKKKGYGRRRIMTITNVDSIRVIFPDMDPISDQSFICSDCLKVFSQQTVRCGKKFVLPRKTKREPSVDCASTSKRLKHAPEAKTTSNSELLSASGLNLLEVFQPEDQPSISFKDECHQLLAQSQYHRLLRNLMKNSKAASSAILDIAVTQVKKELSTVEGEDPPFTTEAFGDLNWKSITEAGRDKCPWSATLLDGMLPPCSKIRKHYRDGKGLISMADANQIRLSRFGVTLSIVMFSHKPNRFKLWQSAFAVNLWRHGVQHVVFKELNRMGLTLSKDAARSHVDKVVAHSDKDVQQWKHDVNIGAKQDDKLYTLTWDNVQWLARSSVQSNKMHLMCLAFASNNRIPSLHLTDNSTVKASDLPLSCFIPQLKDWQCLRDRMVHVTTLILREYFQGFADSKVVQHLPHQHSVALQTKSTVISLGVIEANPSSNEGVHKILDTLHQYVPKSEGGIVPILVNGDGLSVERMSHAKMNRSRAPTDEGRLDGLVVSPQEFHFQALMMQKQQIYENEEAVDETDTSNQTTKNSPISNIILLKKIII